VADLTLTNRVVTQFYAFASFRLIIERAGRRTERSAGHRARDGGRHAPGPEAPL
jgi:hypothetical protein